MAAVKMDYVSDHTRWMNEMMEKHPEWRETQRSGRAMWWDKKQDVETLATYAEAKVPPKPYPYDVNFW